jgi:uncharacterized protein
METPFHKGDPQMLGVPVFVAGSIALGLALAGYLPGGVVGGALPVILAGNGLGLLIATVWAISLGQNMVASIFGVFLGFWWSYPILILGLIHGWLGIPPEDVKRSVAIFLIGWLAVILLLTLGSLPLPSVYTLLLVVVDIALVLILWGTLDESANLTKAGGWAVLVFAAIGGYIFVSVMFIGHGLKGLPMGKPMMRAKG